MPFGILGKRLGTQIEITGEYDYKAKLPHVIWVNAIDRIWRGAPLQIEVRGIQLRKNIIYRLEGYEAGEFSGIPIQYRSFFIATKVIEPSPRAHIR
jgi:hypothetical protein